MSPVPERCIVDTSVVLKWFLEGEDDRDASLLLLAALLDRSSSLLTLELMFYEAGNVLLRRLRSDRHLVVPILSRLLELDIEVIGLDSTLAASAADVAADQRISFYDAAYLAAARTLALPVVTADRRLARAAGPDGLVPSQLR